jgi:cytochrome c oxidase assembly protein subunit 15
MLRALLQLAFVLALIVVGVSATLRLAANGIGCTPWPACYGEASTAAAANEQPATRWLRIAHRIAASAFALVALGVVAAGWRRWQRALRIAGIALLAVTGVLAWIGRHTPSPLPVVTLVNVLGGFALLALFAFLRAAMPVRSANSSGPATVPTLALVALLIALSLQAGSGALISARLAGDACASRCSQVWLPGAALIAHPFVPGAATDLLPRGGQPLQLLHRFAGLALMLLCTIVAGVMVERRLRWAATVMLAAAMTAALGFAIASAAPALPIAVSHALAAGLLLAALAALLAAAKFREEER